MQFSQFIQWILASNPTDWSVISDGPMYRNEYIVSGASGHQGEIIAVKSHYSVAVLKNEMSITIAWGLEENDDFQEDWANKYANPHASSAYVDFFYNGALVMRKLYVVVDSGRCFLPIPDLEVDEDETKVLRRTVNHNDYKLIKLVHSLNAAGSDYDSYMKRAGIELV